CEACGQPLAPASPVTAAPAHPAPDLPGSGIEAVIGIIVGLFILFIQPRFMQWVMHSLFGTQGNNFFNPDGTPVPYFKDGRPFLDVYPGSIEFLTDLGPFTFAIILILNGLVLLLVRKPAAVA